MYSFRVSIFNCSVVKGQWKDVCVWLGSWTSLQSFGNVPKHVKAISLRSDLRDNSLFIDCQQPNLNNTRVCKQQIGMRPIQ